LKAILLNLLLLPCMLVAAVATGMAFVFVWLVFSPFRSRHAYHRMERGIVRYFGRFCLWLLRPIAPVETSGGDFLTHRPEHQIFVLNHKSFSDTFLCSLLPVRDPLVLLNRGASRTPVLGLGIRYLAWINVTDIPFGEWREQCLEELAQGADIICFPEGTRSGSKPTGPFHSGIFRIAVSQGLSVTPVVITGNEETPKRGSIFLKPTRIRMRMLAPVMPIPNEKPFVFKERVRKMMIEELEIMEGKNHVG